VYESKTEPLLAHAAFVRRLLLHGVYSTLLISGSIFIGSVGFIYIEGLVWHDSALSAVLMLGGGGPVVIPITNTGKLFVGLFSLYADFIFVGAMGLVLAPIIHRLLHKFHLDADIQ
jgi:hypothetical protein